jgi:hypothetical protein
MPNMVGNGPIFVNEGKVNNSIIQDLKPMFNESNILGLVSQFDNMRTDERMKLQFQGRIRTGDFNIDGYPDIFLTVRIKNK